MSLELLKTDRDWLYNEYQNKSINKIASECNVSPHTVKKYLKIHNIDIRTQSESIKHKYQTDVEYKQKRLKQFKSKSQSDKIKKAAAINKEKRIESSKLLWTNHLYRLAQINNGKILSNSGEFKQKISESIKKKWEDPEYAAKCRAYNADRLLSMSNAVKLAWQNDEYRKLKSKQSSENWKNKEYRDKVTQSLNDPNVINKISAASKRLWKNKRKLMIEIIKKNYDNQEIIDKLSKASKSNWQNKEYHDKVTKILRIASKKFRSKPLPDHIRTKISDKVKKKWEDPEYREKIAKYNSDPNVKRNKSLASAALWEDPEYRHKLELIYNNEEYKQKIFDNNSRMPKVSSIQIKLYNYLESLGVDFKQEFKLGYYYFDCLVTGKNGKQLLIECQGDYWHSLPKAISRDKSKFTYVDKYFPEYEIMYVWEHEFYTKDRVLDRLKLKLGYSIETVDFSFSDVSVEEAKYADVKHFLNDYHYLGSKSGRDIIVAKFGDVIIGVIVFASPVRQTISGQFNGKSVLELTRLCLHPSYHKYNFCSWFISKSLKLISTDVVVSYCDSTVGHDGAIYKASNFSLHHTVPSDYWYVDKDGYVMNKRVLYSNAVKLKMTEREFAEKYNYHKRYGGHKYCFVRYLK